MATVIEDSVVLGHLALGKYMSSLARQRNRIENDLNARDISNIGQAAVDNHVDRVEWRIQSTQ